MLKRIEPFGLVVDFSKIEPTNPQPHQIHPEDLELEATDYTVIDPPPASDRPYEHRYIPYRGLPGAIAGLLLLIGFTLTVGAVSGAVYHQLQQQGGQASVRR